MTGDFFHQDFERTVRGIKLVAVLFHKFDFRYDPAGIRAQGIDIDAHFPGFVKDVAFAGQIGYHYPPVAAHQFRIDVLVGNRVAHDGADVQAALVTEGAPADKRPAGERGDVGGFADEPGNLFQLFQVFRRHTRVSHFQAEDGNDGGQVGVAAAFAVTVDSALHHVGPGPDAGQGVGHGQSAVVMGVDADFDPVAFSGRVQLIADRPGGPLDILGQGAAVGVAQDQGVGPGVGRGGQGRQGVCRVPGVSVEKMLGVEKHFQVMLFQVSHGVTDHGQVFIQGVVHDFRDMQIPGLADNGHGRGAAFDQKFDVLILLHRHPAFTRGTEGRQPCVLKIDLPGELKKPQVLGVGPRPAAFNVVDAEIIKHPGDSDFILGGEIDVFSLHAVPKGGVIEEDLSHGFQP